MADHITPDAHSTLVGGSTAARRMGCPRSLHLERLVPKTPSSVYAREGTALHEMMARILSQDVAPETLLPFTFHSPAKGSEPAWSFTVDDDLWTEKGAPALAAFDEFVAGVENATGEPFEFVVEQRVAFPGIEGAYGTSDIVGRCADEVFVIDWKFGSGAVEAEGNPQLMFYAVGALAGWSAIAGMVKPDTPVACVIIQPSGDPVVKEWRTDVAELHAMAEELRAAIKAGLELAAEAPIQRGPWCRFADCKAICPLHVSAAADFSERFARLRGLGTGPAQPPGSTPFDWGQFFGEALDVAEVVEEWAAEVRKRALDHAKAGGAVAGRCLVPGRPGNRVWAKPEADVVKFFKNRRFSVNDFMPRSLIGVAAAERLLKASGRDLPEDMTTRPPATGFKLVRDGGGAAVAAEPVGVERVRRLGERLAALAGTV